MRGSFTAFVAIGIAAPASAQMVTAKDPQSVVRAMQAAGYQAALDREEESGSPMISSSSGGKNFAVFFYGCEKGANCTDLQFFAGWNGAKTPLATINDFNVNHRYARAYVSDDGAARVEMDVDVDYGGISDRLFRDYLDVWASVMGKFQAQIGK